MTLYRVCLCGHDKFRHFNPRNAEKSPCKECMCPRYRIEPVKRMRDAKCPICLMTAGRCSCK